MDDKNVTQKIREEWNIFKNIYKRWFFTKKKFIKLI